MVPVGGSGVRRHVRPVRPGAAATGRPRRPSRRRRCAWGAAHESRRWPVGRWGAVVAALRRRGPAGRPHRIAARAPAGAAGGRSCRGPGPSGLWAGRTDLGRLAALVRSASLVVTGDTGMSHLATAYRIPSVTLFGPVSPRLWVRPTTPGTGSCGTAATPCGPVTHGPLIPDERLLRIQPDEVPAHCDHLLAG